MKIDPFLGAMTAGRIPVVSVVVGDEPWFAGRALAALREHFLDGEAPEILDAPKNLNDKEGVPLAAAVDEARTVPMFTGKKAVYYRTRSLGKEDAVLIASLAAAGPGFSRMLVYAETATAAAKKALEAARVPVGEARRLFDTPWPGKPEWDTPLNKWVSARARERGRRMDLRTAHILTGMIGNDLGGLEGALEKLSLSSAGRPDVTEDEIRAMSGGGRDFDAFAFGEAVYGRRANRAFRVERNAFTEGVDDGKGRKRRDASGVAGRLLWSVGYRLKQVYAARLLLDEGVAPVEAAGRLGIRNKAAATRAVQQAGAFTIDVLRRHHVLLANAEADLRTAVPASVVVEALIPELMETDN